MAKASIASKLQKGKSQNLSYACIAELAYCY